MPGDDERRGIAARPQLATTADDSGACVHASDSGEDASTNATTVHERGRFASIAGSSPDAGAFQPEERRVVVGTSTSSATAEPEQPQRHDTERRHGVDGQDGFKHWASG